MSKKIKPSEKADISNTANLLDSGPSWLVALDRKKALVGRKVTTDDVLGMLNNKIKNDDKFYPEIKIDLMKLSDYIFDDSLNRDQKIDAIKKFADEFSKKIETNFGTKLEDEKLYLFINKLSENLDNDKIGHLFSYLFDNISGKGKLEDFSR